jgi:enoyl-CoA hydratase
MEYVKYEQRGAVGILTISREKALNALNSQVIAELSEALDQVNLEEVRALILTGAGVKSFVAGADITEMQKETKAQGQARAEEADKTFRKIETFPVPVIAAVNGYALGGGCELAMSCDIRIASENAVFGQPETGLAIIPGFGGTQRLPRIVGLGKAKELIYTCDRIKADAALNIGLVNAVCPIESLIDTCITMAEKIAKNGPIGVRAAKKAINEGMQLDIDSALKLEAKLFGSCFETEDQKNAMTAFVEKRKPDPFVNK